MSFLVYFKWIYFEENHVRFYQVIALGKLTIS